MSKPDCLQHMHGNEYVLLIEPKDKDVPLTDLNRKPLDARVYFLLQV